MLSSFEDTESLEVDATITEPAKLTSQRSLSQSQTKIGEARRLAFTSARQATEQATKQRMAEWSEDVNGARTHAFHYYDALRSIAVQSAASEPSTNTSVANQTA